jgi:ABC-type glycerol-3-phosphate transport system permease component
VGDGRRLAQRKTLVERGHVRVPDHRLDPRARPDLLDPRHLNQTDERNPRHAHDTPHRRPDARPLRCGPRGRLRSFLLNSLIAASGATTIGFVLTVPAAWGFAKFAYPGSGGLLSFIVVTRVFPPIALALPLFLQFRALGLVDTPVGLIIGYVPIVLPLMIWMLTGFFRDFPDELVEAARIDGLGIVGTLFRIVLPLSLPALGVAILFGFLVAWNEFIIALTLTRTPASQTMPVGISTLITQFQILWGEMMAVAAIYLLPVLAVTIAAQRGLVSGLMSGSSKG